MTLIKNVFWGTMLVCNMAQASSLPQWIIVPNESNLTFTGTQNNAPVSGEFKKINGTIYVDPAKYQESSIDVMIDMNSLSVAYSDLASILVTPDWFNLKAFPKAEYKATKFNKINEQTYEALGVLTIKGKSVPTTLTFTAVESPKNHAVVNGHTTIKRNAFGVGSGEWSSTETIKDEVQVNFKIVATRKE